MHEEAQPQSWSILLTPGESDLFRRSRRRPRPREKGRRPMAARRMNLVRQRLAITRSAAGVPRTYRIIRPSSWGRRVAVLLRRLVPWHPTWRFP